jgi:hypothetical protein
LVRDANGIPVVGLWEPIVTPRERWNSGQLDLAQKRALTREALHAVIVLPVGGGGRRPFNPDLLVPKWRD